MAVRPQGATSSRWFHDSTHNPLPLWVTETHQASYSCSPSTNNSWRSKHSMVWESRTVEIWKSKTRKECKRRQTVPCVLCVAAKCTLCFGLGCVPPIQTRWHSNLWYPTLWSPEISLVQLPLREGCTRIVCPRSNMPGDFIRKQWRQRLREWGIH